MSYKLCEIKPHLGTQHESFEALVCELVQRTDALNSSSWTRFDGAGGDGGVEAIWSPAAGKLTGIQAKFFTKSGDIDWSQIESSFKTALKIHPSLTEYRIYLACNLTGPTGKGGKSGLDKWKGARGRMQAHAQSLGRSVNIVLLTETEIQSDLTRPQAVGLREFWFGTIEITPERLKLWLASAVAALGERYHPEDHVAVDAQRVLQSLSRAPAVREKLIALVDKVLQLDGIKAPSFWADQSDKTDEISKANKLVEELARIKQDATTDPSRTWPVPAWKDQIKAALTALEELIRFSYELVDRKDNQDLASMRNRLFRVSDLLHELQNLLYSASLEAERTGAAIFVGPAGGGKSHLLAASAGEILADGGICVLFLGHRFTQDEIWSQIAKQLGAPGKNKAQILGALNAAAVARQRRAVIIIDALNEGPFRSRWPAELHAFINDVRDFPSVVVALSCRDVFVEHVIPGSVRSHFPLVEVRGFETEEEQERAARVFLDRRGIARPPVPWLAPELINPLFLRSCAVALQQSRKNVFPTGLHGTKQLLAFYLEAVSQTLGTNWDGGTSLAASCKTALASIAKAMASAKRDWLERHGVDRLVGESFATFIPPTGMTWLDVLLRNGVLRGDPHPEVLESTDPLDAKSDVVRFAFQRFQDHLMAEALLHGQTNPQSLFSEDGELAFILNRRGVTSWEWSGLVEALSIQLPETLKVELVDVLPGGKSRHWRDYSLQAAFVQSIKWRDPTAISGRSLELAKDLDSESENLFSLLIELAARPDHPWNAEKLDRNLRAWPMLRRDQSWTVYISTHGIEENRPVDRLITWSETATKDNADCEVLWLCAIALAWLLTSSARLVRDRATKALASLFVERTDLFPRLMQKFASLDDLYVVERVAAAGYGALLRWPTDERARSYSTTVWDCFFKSQKLPPNILLLDYLSGIMEVANALHALPTEVDIEKTRPPFLFDPPTLDVTKAEVEKIAKEAGGDQIYHSCGEWGDFQRYKVAHRLDEITKIPLTQAPPALTVRQRAYRFEREMGANAARRVALDRLSAVYAEARKPIMTWLDNDNRAFEISEAPPDPRWEESLEAAESEFLQLLSIEEAERYHKDWLPAQPGQKGAPAETTIETWRSLEASYWIAKRAYAFGWTAKRFGNDIGHYYGGERANVERIGKKYQWLARSELLARLVNNFWLIEPYDDGGPKCYQRATDIGFERDIEPTFFSSPKHANGQEFGKKLGLVPLLVPISRLDGPERLAWPFQEETILSPSNLIEATDQNGQRWIRLSWYISRHCYTDQYRKAFGHNFAQRHWLILRAVIIRRGERKGMVRLLKHNKIDLWNWEPPKYVDGPYLYELDLDSVWRNQRWHLQQRWSKPSFEVAWPFEEWAWESHLDKSLPNGAHAKIVAPWLMNLACLELDSTSPQLTRRDNDIIGWSCADRDADQNGLIVDAEWFETVLEQENLECIWIAVGEREAWIDNNHEGPDAYRRYDCVCSGTAGAYKAEVLSEDRRPASATHEQSGQ